MFYVEMLLNGYTPIVSGNLEAEATISTINALCYSYGEAEVGQVCIHMNDIARLRPGETFSGSNGYLAYTVTKPALPNLHEALKPFREAGYMIVVFEPEELKGCNPEAMKESLTESGNEYISMNYENYEDEEDEELKRYNVKAIFNEDVYALNEEEAQERIKAIIAKNCSTAGISLNSTAIVEVE